MIARRSARTSRRSNTFRAQQKYRRLNEASKSSRPSHKESIRDSKTSAEGPSELVSVHLGVQSSIDIDLEMEKLLGHIPIEASGAESLGAENAVQYALRGQSGDASDLESEGDSSHS
eukprot:8490456-Pyramimonas_sp.AAC.1